MKLMLVGLGLTAIGTVVFLIAFYSLVALAAPNLAFFFVGWLLGSVLTCMSAATASLL